jgi:tRNA(fMet)-specific endonuclease VapC
MNYILDTSILVEIENNNQEIICKINDLKKTPFTELCITIFTFCEFYHSAMEKNQKNKEKVLRRLQQYKILNTTEETGIRFCELYHALKKKGKEVPQFDTFIAAIAMEYGCVLITMDKDFSRIPGLKTIFLEFCS